MSKITTNADELAKAYQERAAALTPAVARGLLKAAVAVDIAQVENLRGSNADAPGSYPVPARSGHLLGAHFFEVQNEHLAIVGNSAEYALPIHEGQGSSAKYGRRPFLDDAVDKVDPTAIVQAEVSKEIMAIA